MQSLENETGTVFQSSTITTSQNYNFTGPREDDEDFKAFARHHTYTVAYASFPYESLTQEQEIIDYLLKRVVFMREMPLANAAKSLEFARDLK